MFDREALDGFGWWHWQVLKIPANVTGLPEGAGTKDGKRMPKGSVQGNGDLGRVGYLGPCPDKGTGVHHYVFTPYAIKTAAAETARNASLGMILAYVMSETPDKAPCKRTDGR